MKKNIRILLLIFTGLSLGISAAIAHALREIGSFTFIT